MARKSYNKHTYELIIPKFTGRTYLGEYGETQIFGEERLYYSKFYYRIEFNTDDDNRFISATTYRIGGADCDGAHGGEWYEALKEREIPIIVEYIEKELE